MDTTERIPMTRREARDLAAAGWAAYTLAELSRPSRPQGHAAHERSTLTDRLVRWLQPAREYWDKGA